MPSRRELLAGAGAGLLLGLVPGLSVAALPGGRRLVVVLLRGGLDGLHAVPPIRDPDYAQARGSLALPEGEVLPLEAPFALHPALAPLLPYWQGSELAIVHAVASPYRERSHFDGQDMLEGGGTRPHELSDGWLNRALDSLGAGRGVALAVAQGLPLILRGATPASSWAPSPLPGLPAGLVEKVAALYAGDALLATAFEEGVQANVTAGEAMADEPPVRGRLRDFPALAHAAGHLLAAAEGPRVAVLELGGWDTHAGQGLTQGRMADSLARLAGGLDALAKALGPAWRDAVVVAVSEFGRTVAANGTGGSDHGTGGVALVMGGRVAGGAVLGQWPGLAPNALYQGRDLRPTTDLRAVLKAVLRDHLGVGPATLDTTVFPHSAGVAPLAGLIRT
ncbi:MAG: DUF1501 domain-containing protein [Magnetospirillum sp.]|nr:DUF1501 domain-containing protein [Magnetospirillum sp.]